MYSPETTSRIAALRAKAVDGSLTAEELAEGIKLMRADRFAAVKSSTAKAASGGKRAKPSVNVADIFADLDKL